MPLRDQLQLIDDSHKFYADESEPELLLVRPSDIPNFHRIPGDWGDFNESYQLRDGIDRVFYDCAQAARYLASKGFHIDTLTAMDRDTNSRMDPN